MSAEAGNIQKPFSRDVSERLDRGSKHKQKHKASQKPRIKASPTLKSPFLDRVFSLPAELRLQIYRHILIRPCKFNLSHLPTCDGHPFITDGALAFRASGLYLRCVECRPLTFKSWQAESTCDSPAWSQWAPPKKNPFFCDECYADKMVELGMERVPDLRGVMCLCARRDLGALLVSWRIYDEAAPVFWKENTFAFESGRLLEDFLEEIAEEKRSMIRAISLVAPSNMFMDLEELPPVWPLLRLCEGLREIELDSRFLDDLPSVLGLSTISVRSVRFVEKVTLEEYSQPNRWIRPWVANRTVYSDRLSSMLSTGMTGDIVDENRLRQAFVDRARLRRLVEDSDLRD
ncbi:hypothetical protein BDV06DRAFT_234043 [Aspergillus oleicola]